MSSIRQGADSADRPEIHVEQDDALTRLGLFSSCPPASAFQKIDFGDIVLGTDFFSTNLSKLIDSSKIWAESTGLVTAYYGSVMSKIPIDGLVQAVSSIYNRSSVFAGISKIAAEFSAGVAKTIGQAIKAQDIALPLLESLRPSIDAIEKVLDNLDAEGFWESCRESAKEWGRHGWVLLDGMTMSMIKNSPTTFPEANRFLKPIALASLPETKAAILANARKRKDTEEMFSLYEERHYKPCAMMACSLIEGEIINWKISKTRTRKVNSKPTSLTIAEDVASSQQAMVDLVSTIAAYDHFFRNTTPFNRKLEGELNRNSLMHGMMHKDVTQVACLKLFNLLEKVTGLLPSCAIDG
ncbi:MAG: hypothetical protein SPG07_09345 [Coriobacteriales bacterium]|nr:hypothetical protein [Coriobacteriales bacterium]